MFEAALWGFVGSGSLLVGAVVGYYAGIPRRVISLIMALGAGVLISSVAFELTAESYRRGGFAAASIGLLLGAGVFFLSDRAVNRRGGSNRKNSGDRQQDGSATALAVGALLDGVPESAAIGISLLEGSGVSVALVAAVFLSNIPEGLSSASGMRRAGRSPAYVFGLWFAVVAVSGLAAVFGYAFLDNASGSVVAAMQAFAAGAILTMLASTMMPEAYEEGGEVVGIVTTVGFLIAFILSQLE